jgi:hypothetical protein
MPSRTHRGLPLPLFLLTAFLSVCPVGAQSDDLPGVRGTLYESPTYGWILIAQLPDWIIVDAASADGVDAVHLVSFGGDGADQFFISRMDDGRGVTGCVEEMVASIGAMYDGSELQGWYEPDVEFEDYGPDDAVAYARVPSAEDPDRDILAYVGCTRGQDGLLIGEALLRTARDLDGGFAPAAEVPYRPGEWHTGRARGEQVPDSDGDAGVVRFLAREFPPDESGYPFPFSCLDQETFARPSEPPPPDRGWYACDGKIANVDVVPVTIDLMEIVIGCENLAPGEEVSGCPDEPVAPSYVEVLAGPVVEEGSLITLAPGESADVDLWYALPGGDPPLELYYREPDRLVLVGPTFFTAGTGSRIPVVVSR